MNSKKRYCECGRELEKYQRQCSECAYYYDQIAKDLAQHTYRQTPKYYDSLAKSNQKRIDSGYFKEYDKTPKRKEWRKSHEKTRLEYKRDWQRRKKEKLESSKQIKQAS